MRTPQAWTAWSWETEITQPWTHLLPLCLFIFSCIFSPVCLVFGSRRCYSASKWSTVRPGKKAIVSSQFHKQSTFSLQWDAMCDATKAWFEHVTHVARSRAVALFNAFEAKPIEIPQTRDNKITKVTKPCTESHFSFVGIVKFVSISSLFSA